MVKAPLFSIILATFLISSVIGPMPQASAENISLPVPGVMVHLSPLFDPPILKGIKVNPDNPFKFDFILDQGSGPTQGRFLQQEATKLIKYFLASLTIPENDLWVNLSPYEKNRIIPQSFGLTEMGRDLLAEDYMLKQITASLIYPEGEIGKKFWERIYAEAAKRYGTTNIPVNTFNKVWIIPDKAVIYENAKVGTAYVVASKLKVMLEQDYLSLTKHQSQPGDMALPVSPSTLPSGRALNAKASQGNTLNALGSKILREIVIPELTREVNENKNFTQLRQVYNSLILATWYKKKIKDSILEQVYADKKKIVGVGYENSTDVEYIYQQYLKAFKKGVYNYIKDSETPNGVSDATLGQSVPRKYFSGGMLLSFAMATDDRNTSLSHASQAMSIEDKPVPQNLGHGQLTQVTVDFYLNMKQETEQIFNDLISKLELGTSLLASQQEQDSISALFKRISGQELSVIEANLALALLPKLIHRYTTANALQRKLMTRYRMALLDELSNSIDVTEKSRKMILLVYGNMFPDFPDVRQHRLEISLVGADRKKVSRIEENFKRMKRQMANSCIGVNKLIMDIQHQHAKPTLDQFLDEANEDWVGKKLNDVLPPMAASSSAQRIEAAQNYFRMAYDVDLMIPFHNDEVHVAPIIAKHGFELYSLDQTEEVIQRLRLLDQLFSALPREQILHSLTLQRFIIFKNIRSHWQPSTLVNGNYVALALRDFDARDTVFHEWGHVFHGPGEVFPQNFSRVRVLEILNRYRDFFSEEFWESLENPQYDDSGELLRHVFQFIFNKRMAEWKELLGQGDYNVPEIEYTQEQKDRLAKFYKHFFLSPFGYTDAPKINVEYMFKKPAIDVEDGKYIRNTPEELIAEYMRLFLLYPDRLSMLEPLAYELFSMMLGDVQFDKIWPPHIDIVKVLFDARTTQFPSHMQDRINIADENHLIIEREETDKIDLVSEIQIISTELMRNAMDAQKTGAIDVFTGHLQFESTLYGTISVRNEISQEALRQWMGLENKAIDMATHDQLYVDRQGVGVFTESSQPQGAYEIKDAAWLREQLNHAEEHGEGGLAYLFFIKGLSVKNPLIDLGSTGVGLNDVQHRLQRMGGTLRFIMHGNQIIISALVPFNDQIVSKDYDVKNISNQVLVDEIFAENRSDIHPQVAATRPNAAMRSLISIPGLNPSNPAMKTPQAAHYFAGRIDEQNQEIERQLLLLLPGLAQQRGKDGRVSISARISNPKTWERQAFDISEVFQYIAQRLIANFISPIGIKQAEADFTPIEVKSITIDFNAEVARRNARDFTIFTLKELLRQLEGSGNPKLREQGLIIRKNINDRLETESRQWLRENGLKVTNTAIVDGLNKEKNILVSELGHQDPRDTNVYNKRYQILRRPLTFFENLRLYGFELRMNRFDHNHVRAQSIFYIINHDSLADRLIGALPFSPITPRVRSTLITQRVSNSISHAMISKFEYHRNRIEAAFSNAYFQRAVGDVIRNMVINGNESEFGLANDQVSPVTEGTWLKVDFKRSHYRPFMAAHAHPMLFYSEDQPYPSSLDIEFWKDKEYLFGMIIWGQVGQGFSAFVYDVSGISKNEDLGITDLLYDGILRVYRLKHLNPVIQTQEEEFENIANHPGLPYEFELIKDPTEAAKLARNIDEDLVARNMQRRKERWERIDRENFIKKKDAELLAITRSLGNSTLFEFATRLPDSEKMEYIYPELNQTLVRLRILLSVVTSKYQIQATSPSGEELRAIKRVEMALDMIKVLLSFKPGFGISTDALLHGILNPLTRAKILEVFLGTRGIGHQSQRIQIEDLFSVTRETLGSKYSMAELREDLNSRRVKVLAEEKVSFAQIAARRTNETANNSPLANSAMNAQMEMSNAVVMNDLENFFEKLNIENRAYDAAWEIIDEQQGTSKVYDRENLYRQNVCRYNVKELAYLLGQAGIKTFTVQVQSWRNQKLNVLFNRIEHEFLVVKYEGRLWLVDPTYQWFLSGDLQGGDKPKILVKPLFLTDALLSLKDIGVPERYLVLWKAGIEENNDFKIWVRRNFGPDYWDKHRSLFEDTTHSFAMMTRKPFVSQAMKTEEIILDIQHSMRDLSITRPVWLVGSTALYGAREGHDIDIAILGKMNRKDIIMRQAISAALSIKIAATGSFFNVPIIMMDLHMFSLLNDRLRHGIVYRITQGSVQAITENDSLEKFLQGDLAMNGHENLGGIDLTPPHMNVQTQNSNGGIKFYLNPAMLAQLRNAPGLIPVIIKMQPLKNLKAFLETSN